MLFNESILFHAVNNFDDKRIKKFKRLCKLLIQNNFFKFTFVIINYNNYY